MFKIVAIRYHTGVFWQIRKEPPLHIFEVDYTAEVIDTERTKGLIDVKYTRTAVKRLSLSNSLVKIYTWLQEWNVIPINLKDIRGKLVEQWVMNVVSHCR